MGEGGKQVILLLCSEERQLDLADGAGGFFLFQASFLCGVHTPLKRSSICDTANPCARSKNTLMPPGWWASLEECIARDCSQSFLISRETAALSGQSFLVLL